MHFNLHSLYLVFFLIVLTGCSSDIDYYSDTGEVAVVAEVGSVPDRVELPQGWDAERRQSFWFTSQGGQIIPYTWFTWLEQAGSTEYFRSAEHMESLRY